MIPLAYGTYGLNMLDPAEAFPAIAAAGYDALELTIADGYPGVSPDMDRAAGERIAGRAAEAGLPIIAALLKETVLDSGSRTGMSEATLDALIRSACHCGIGEEAILTCTMGGAHAEWPERRNELVDRLRRLGQVAADAGAVLAVEPHAHGLIDSVDRADWLMQAVDHAGIRLNFDVSHYALPGVAFDLGDAVRRLLPFAVHAHIKDSVPNGDGFRFVLPGEGAFDLAGFFAALHAAGWHRPVTVEVSAMVFNTPGYQPLDAMRASFSALDAARRRGIRSGPQVRAS